MKINNLSNKELYNLCKEIGALTLKYRNQFIGLIPEVYKRKLYRNHKIASIHEFAAKLAGISYEVVNRVIRLDKKLEDRPNLKEKLNNGTIGWAKLELVEKIATPSTDQEWSKKAETISKSALVTLTQDIKSQDTNILQKNFKKLSLELSVQNLQQLQILKNKFQTLTWNETITELLKRINKTEPFKTRKKTKKAKYNVRYIPSETRKEAYQSTNNLCSHSGCNKPATTLHHEIPFAISKNHNSIIPLCKNHHDIIHHQNNTYINNQYTNHKRAYLNQKSFATKPT